MIERFGKYELLRRIGVGGMAEVFVARTSGAGGFVKHLVLKRILPALNQDPDFVNMFIEEARLAAKLHHTNIVQIFDFAEVDGCYFIAMEWVEGADLRRVQNVARRRGRALAVDFGVHVGVEALKGLHYAHSRMEAGLPLRLIHRDISPHNLLLSFSGEVKIADFGIAKVAALSAVTGTGVLKGKLRYMSPEQAGGEDIDQRSDLYSLGVVLWELFSGQRPYHANSERELMGQVVDGKIESLGDVTEGLPQGLVAVVDRLLDKDVDQRYETAAQALSSLGRFAAVGDSLNVAEVIRELLPLEANRESRGNTEAIAHVSGEDYREAVPQAHTSGRSVGSRSSAMPHQPDSNSSSDADLGRSDQTLSTEGSVLARYLPLAFFVLLGLAAGWGAMAYDGDPPPSTKASDVVSLRVESDPPGLALRLNGIALEESTPIDLQGGRGKRVLVEVTQAGRTSTQNAIMGDQKKLRLVLPPPDLANVTSKPTSPSTNDAATKTPLVVTKKNESPSRPKAMPFATSPRQSRGWLSVYVDPWARIYLGGKNLGLTPIKKHRVMSGQHELLLVNPDLGRRVQQSIDVGAGKEKVIRVNWR